MGLFTADTERRHNMRLYTCVHGGAGRRGRGALSACSCACVKYRARRKEWLVLCPIIKKNEWNKWKNHFYEMKGDVGMSLHEKGRNKKMPTPRHKVTHNPIPTSLFLPTPQHNIFRRQLDVKMFCCLLCLYNAFITNKQTNNKC